jgi:hypothetical protein
MIRSQYLTGVGIALGLSTVVVVAAQAFPAGERLGAPIQFTHTQSRAEVQAAYVTSAQTAQTAQAPQALRVGPADPSTGMVQRAMVEADRNLWLRAGLGDVGEFDDSVSPTYKERHAAYERMRNGPEFAMELARINGGAHTASLAKVSE